MANSMRESKQVRLGLPTDAAKARPNVSLGRKRRFRPGGPVVKGQQGTSCDSRIPRLGARRPTQSPYDFDACERCEWSSQLKRRYLKEETPREQ